MTRDELLAEVRQLEGKVFSLMDDDSKQTEFDEAIQRVEELTGIARQEGWL